MISKSNSSELTAFLGYDVVQGQLLKLNNLLKERIEERVKGYRNEMLGIKLTKEIISEHKLPLRVKSTSKLDLQGVDFLVTTKRDSFIPFQIKSSAIDIVKEFYKSEKINVLVIDGNKEVGEIKQNIWSIIKDFCILKKIPYV